MRHCPPPALFALCLLTAPLMAQTLTHLSGQILDPSGAAVPGATVSVASEDTGFRRVTMTHSDGTYLVAALQPGQYKVMVRKDGFRTLVRFGVKLDVAQAARVDFNLQIGSMQETITVEDTPAGVSREETSVSTLIGRDPIENLPLNGRGILSLLELAPGTVVTPATRGEAGQFTANGQRPNTHGFTVDGVSANSGVIGGGLPAQTTGGTLPSMTAIGGLAGIVALDSLNEFVVQTSSTGSEFGRYPGAQVSLSSRSGSNEYRGTLTEFFRHEKLAANDWFANQPGEGRAPLRVNNFGVSLGGPVAHDRTFFFLNYEGLRLLQPTSWIQAVPTAQLRGKVQNWVRPVLDMFPLPNGRDFDQDIGEWTGRISRPARSDNGSARVDHALTSKITLFSRFQDAPSSSEFGSSQISKLSIGSRSFTAAANFRVRPDTVFDLRFNVASMEAYSVWSPADPTDSSGCAMSAVASTFLPSKSACHYLYRFSIAGVGQTISGAESIQRQSQWQILPSGYLVKGTHQLRFGGDVRRLAPSRHDVDGSFSIIAESLEDLVESRNLWTASSTPQSRAGTLFESSLYVQDTWRIHRALTLTSGLRWELAPAPVTRDLTENPFGGTPSNAVNSAAWPMRYTNLAPRLGLAWRPDRRGQMVVRAAFGVYYDSSLSLSTDLVNGGPLNMEQFTSGSSAPFTTVLQYGFDNGLRLPRVQQWNVSLERAFGPSNLLSTSYVGATGQWLVRREYGNVDENPLLRMVVSTNHGSSDYRALLVQFRRRMARSLQAQVSYSWSHSIDDSSSDAALFLVSPATTASSNRGSSDFDARHSFTAAFTFAPRRLRGLTFDGIYRARTGFPITVVNEEYAMGLSFSNAFRPDLVPGVPVWLQDPTAPGGRRLNEAAFRETPASIQGNLGRNAIAGFGMSQFDLAVRRDFRIGLGQTLELRGEAFNVFNHPNFADPVRTLASPLFGQSNSMLNLMLGTGSPGSGLAPVFQSGGSRSLQMVLRLRF
ncbi:carboxypeptidase-like regulatory domain-containing protein [uncultured Paludibaculum sp.]|uniref:TonB-dependent receptor n=1 Tax=uncultured Paludibaculum sp. TaxID=1765020 RepID=UPI002AAA662F|nr:carboxypeptidase-like regulatory domain-containing protein [uncultured Paludibaculum sp.]